MSEHTWTQENIAAFVVGGLTAEEAERLDAHVRDCPDCAAAVAAARGIDRGLGKLFADVRPGVGLEDGTIQSLRVGRKRRFSRVIRLPRIAIAAGILLVLSIVGAMGGALVDNGRLPLPGFALLGPSRRSRSEVDVVKNSNVASATDAVRGAISGRDEKWGDGEEGSSAANYWNFGGGRRHNGDAASEPAKPAASSSYNATMPVDGQGQRLVVPRLTAQSAGPGNAAQFGFPQQPTGYGGIAGISGGQAASIGISGSITGGGISGGIGGVPQYGNYHTESMTGATSAPNGVTFQPGGSMPVRGTPMNSKPAASESKTFTVGGVMFGAFPASVAGMPVHSPLPAGFSSFRPGEHRPESPAEVKRPEPASDDKPNPNDPKPPLAPDAPPANRRVVLRSGEMEFEVDSFDAAAAAITKLVAGLNGAFVATVNSDKLANGKVRGSIVVRTPPEHLDRLVLDLRRDLGANGQLKGMKIGSQDITKQYTDLESRLRAARSMEQRLLQMIKDGKGEIKQLLEAEKELGVWRTKIEETEGEIRYYANLAALSTLTLTITEKEIRAAAAVTESERVQAGVEVEDVDKAYQQTLAAVAEAKGRIAKSELKQLAAGQFNASLQFEVPPEAGGPIRDRLHQIGRVVRLEIDRSQHAQGGSAQPDAKVKRGDTLFVVQIYNLSDMAARETTTLQVAVRDVRAAYTALRDAAGKASARVLVAQLNEQDAQQVNAQIEVQVPRKDEASFRAALDAAGEVISRQVTRAPEGEGVTDSKVQFRAALLSVDRLTPRDTTTLQVAVPDVRTAYQGLREAAVKAAGRLLIAQLNEQDAQHVTGQIEVEVRRADEAAFRTALDAVGEVVSRQMTRAPEGTSATDSKVKYQVAIFGVNRLSPRETTALTLEVNDVDQALAGFAGQVAEAKGRQLSAQSTRESTGKVTAQASYEVPQASAGLADRFKAAGKVRGYQSTKDPQAPAGKYATVRIDVTLVSGDQIVSEGDGLWPQIRRGLTISMAVLLTSVTWVIFGLCVVLPWGVVIYGFYRLLRRRVVSRPAVSQS